MIRSSLIIIILGVVSFYSNSFAQTAPGKYWLQFKDKNNNPYSVARPLEFLSQRALQRRINQHIPVTWDDLPVTQSYVDSLQKLGVVILNKSRWFNAVTIQSTDTPLLDTITKLSFIKTIEIFLPAKEKSGVERHSSVESLNDNNFDMGNFNYGLGSNQIEMLKGQVLHDFGFDGEGKLIAILDAGFYRADSLPAFDSIVANNQILATRDFVRGGNAVYDQATHGMMVLSIIAGNLPGQLVGTAPKAEFLLLRTEDANSEYIIEEDNWVSGAEFADSAGADIISCSLGYTTFDNSAQNHTYASMNGKTSRASIAATRAARKGMIVVNSAGNSGANSWHYIGAPADADSILTVGAVDSLNSYAYFSSTGPTFDRRIKPDVVARGVVTVIEGVDGHVAHGNGTSFSAPLISGMVACLWEANPLVKNMDVINAVRACSDQYTHPDSLKGYGLPDFSYANSILHGIGHNDFSVESLLNVYPNPFSDYFDIRFYSVENQNIRISVYNILAEKVIDSSYRCSAFTVNYIKINSLKDLEQGVYILRIFSNSKVYQQKLLNN